MFCVMCYFTVLNHNRQEVIKNGKDVISSWGQTTSCTSTILRIWKLIRTARKKQQIPSEWQQAISIFILKEIRRPPASSEGRERRPSPFWQGECQISSLQINTLKRAARKAGPRLFRMHWALLGHLGAGPACKETEHLFVHSACTCMYMHIQMLG